MSLRRRYGVFVQFLSGCWLPDCVWQLLVVGGLAGGGGAACGVVPTALAQPNDTALASATATTRAITVREERFDMMLTSPNERNVGDETIA